MYIENEGLGLEFGIEAQRQKAGMLGLLGRISCGYCLLYDFGDWIFLELKRVGPYSSDVDHVGG